MMIRKRIELKGIGIEEIVKNSGENGEIPSPDIGVSFVLEGEDLDGYGPHTAAAVTDGEGRRHPAMGGWPETELSFVIAEEDVPRAEAWFTDDYRGVTSPESATLQKNRASAVRNLLKDYFTAATASNLFTSPFRIAWRCRRADGSSGPLREAPLVHTFLTPPLLTLTSASVKGTRVWSRVQVRNVPARLCCRVDLSEKEKEDLAENVESIEIFAARQVSLFPSSPVVDGVRSVMIGDAPHRCWHYVGYVREEVESAVAADSDFRLIASISIDEIGQYEELSAIPLRAGVLTEFNSLPKSDPVSPGEMIPAGSRVTTVASALDFGYPDKDKSLRSIMVRGVFDRENVRLRLYGSRHRENWQMVAEVPRPYLSGVAGVRYRWFRVEIERTHREGDFLQALYVGFCT